MLEQLYEWMQRGGPVMWVLAALSTMLTATLGERFYVLWLQYRLDLDAFVDQLMNLVESDQHGQALALCSAEDRHPFASIAKAGLLKPYAHENDLQRAMEAAALRVGLLVGKRSQFLGMVANIATLLGLLGTVGGLIEAFSGIAEAEAAIKQEILASGIAVAMLTTAFGLAIAILAFSAGAVLQAKQDALITAMDAKATELLNYLAQQTRAGSQRAG